MNHLGGFFLLKKPLYDIISPFERGCMDSNQKNKWISLYYDYLDNDYPQTFGNQLDIILYNLVIELEKGIRSGSDSNYFMDDDSKDDIRVEFISKLYNLFTRINSNNKEGEVLDACKLFYHLKDSRSYIPDALEMYFFPQDAYLTNSINYHFIWNNIIRTYNNDNSINFDRKYFKALPQNIKQILDMYGEYLDYMDEDPRYDNDWEHNHFFKEFMGMVISFFHKEKYDISLFPMALDYVNDHIDELEELYKLNCENVEESFIYDYSEMFVNKIMNDVMGDKPIIR